MEFPGCKSTKSLRDCGRGITAEEVAWARGYDPFLMQDSIGRANHVGMAPAFPANEFAATTAQSPLRGLLPSICAPPPAFARFRARAEMAREWLGVSPRSGLCAFVAANSFARRA